MTIHAREHQDFLRRLGDLTRELDAQIEYLDSLRQDLAQDDHDATEDTRARLGEARTAVGAALGSIEQARVQLPLPSDPLLAATRELENLLDTKGTP